MQKILHFEGLMPRHRPPMGTLNSRSDKDFRK
jgi:hypothetical protein